MNLLDIAYVLKWYFVLFVFGLSFLPLTLRIFSNFKDRGYIFSKIISLSIISYIVFILGISHILKFNFFSVAAVLFLCFFINYYLLRSHDAFSVFRNKIKVFLLEEFIFFIALFFWAFIRNGFPEIHGLEKFMDFGFLNSILRSDYFPPKDIWYTPASINYYYFGHLMTAVLTKASFIPSFISYNLMVSALFALTFTTSISIGMNIFDSKRFSLRSSISGILTGIFVTFGGNLTTIYAFFKAYTPADNPVPFWQLPFLPLNFPNGFWYPNATRFIPFTIHEFPIYSFVVSDLHGHVLDIPFVLLIIAILFSLFLKSELKIKNLKLEIPLISFLLAVMYMTNAWDGFIYLLLILLIFTFFYIYQHWGKWALLSKNMYVLIKNFLFVCFGFIAFSIPFSFSFKPFVSGIGIICAPTFLTNLEKIGPFLFEANHCQRSPIWQLLILYGFFYFFVISFLVLLRVKKNYKFSRSDAFILILITFSSLLLLIPEFIYIKDIYPLHYRANTMFKLSYEAFITLSICCSYILIKIISEIKNKIILSLFFLLSLFFVCLNLIYPFFAINSYYRNLNNQQGLDGIKYLSILYPDDYKLVNWINNNINGQPVVLEASGDSYTDYARISANTGLPTVIGWSVHEWLWRGSYSLVAPRIEDVKTLYTTKDINLIKILLKKYNISYVVISSLERERYANLNEANFKKLAKIIYKNGSASLYKINSSEF